MKGITKWIDQVFDDVNMVDRLISRYLVVDLRQALESGFVLILVLVLGIGYDYNHCRDCCTPGDSTRCNDWTRCDLSHHHPNCKLRLETDCHLRKRLKQRSVACM